MTKKRGKEKEKNSSSPVASSGGSLSPGKLGEPREVTGQGSAESSQGQLQKPKIINTEGNIMLILFSLNIHTIA